MSPGFHREKQVARRLGRNVLDAAVHVLGFAVVGMTDSIKLLLPRCATQSAVRSWAK